MKKLYLLFILFISLFKTQGQNSISGVVNSYYQVNVIDACLKLAVVSNANGLVVGDLVLIYQAKGALIDSTSNDSTFGRILNYQSAGKCELARITQITNNTVYFDKTLLNTYQAEGLVQLVKVPEYGNVEIANVLTGNSWNGRTGGVLAIKAQKVTLNDTISMTGKGFRGGNQSVVNSTSFPLSNSFYPSTSYNGEKGEGIAQLGIGRIQGWGPQGNGGGGGNAHNAGGGGGSNLNNRGGFGGGNPTSVQWAAIGGRGGFRLNNFSYTIFMGGGGGGGQTNEQALGRGGSGGGIVIIIADTLVGNFQRILVDGNPGQNAPDDAGGGGGGGGAVFLDVQRVIGQVAVSALGGRGGFATNGSHPGGGGGGGGGPGILYLKNGIQGAGQVSSFLSSGAAGQSSGSSIGFTNGTSSNATNTPIFSPSFIQSPGIKAMYAFSADTVCRGTVTTIRMLSNPLFNLQFQILINSSVVLPNGNGSYQYTFPSTGNGVVEVRSSFNGCTDTSFFSVHFKTQPNAQLFIPDSIGCLPYKLAITAQGSDFAFLLSSRFGTRTMADNPWRDTLIYNHVGCDTLRLVRFNTFGCSDTSAAKVICLYPTPKALFALDDTSSCGFVYVRLRDSSTNVFNAPGSFLRWDFGDGTPPLILNQPSGGFVYHPFQQSGRFDVRLIASNGQCADTMLRPQVINITPAPRPGFTVNFPIDSISRNGFLRKSIEACVPFSLQYFDLSQGAIDSVRFLLNTNKLNSSIVNIAQPQTQYIVQQVYGTTGCITTDTIHIIAKNRSRPGLLIADTVNSCRRREVILRGTFLDTDSVKIDWLMSPNNYFSGIWTDTLQWQSSRVYTNNSLFGYKIFMKAKGCMDSISENNIIQIRPRTIADFILSDTLTCIRKPIVVTNQSQHADSTWISFFHTTSPQWNYTLLSSNSVSRAFSTPGIWSISIVSKSKEGCIDSLKKEIRVIDIQSFNYTINDSVLCGSLIKTLQIQATDSIEVINNGIKVFPSAFNIWKFRLTSLLPDTLRITIRIFNQRCDSLIELELPYQIRALPSLQFSFPNVNGCTPFQLLGFLKPREIDTLYFRLPNGNWNLIPSIDTNLLPFNWSYLFSSSIQGKLSIRWTTLEGCRGESEVANLNINETPQLRATLFPTEGCSPLRSQFLASTQDADSIIWTNKSWRLQEQIFNNYARRDFTFFETDSLKISLKNSTCQFDTSIFVSITGFNNTPRLVMSAASVDSIEAKERVKLFWNRLEGTSWIEVSKSTDSTQWIIADRKFIQEKDSTWVDLNSDVKTSRWYKITAFDSCNNAAFSINPIKSLALNTRKDSNQSFNIQLTSSGTENLIGVYRHREDWINNIWNSLDSTAKNIPLNDQEDVSIQYSIDSGLTSLGYVKIFLTENRNGIWRRSNTCIDTINSKIWLPTAFTPNNNNLNEVLRPIGLGIKNITMQVWNRWGQLIFNESGRKVSWNGKWAENWVEPGLYVVILNAEGFDGNIHNIKQYVYLNK